MSLAEPKNTIAVLQKHAFRFQKRYGQNFLIDPRVLQKIVNAAEIAAEDYVLEIGPGIGTLTEALSDRAKKVVAVEIDESLIPILEENLSGRENIAVRNEDILKTDLPALFSESGGRRWKVVANLPYYITTPILMRLLESRLPIDNITVMVQKEVAERMKAEPGTKDYGALSLAVRYFSEPYLAANVPPNCFMPRPDVSSAVIRLSVRTEPAVQVRDPELLFRIIRASFRMRRKTLSNALRKDPEIAVPPELTEEALQEIGKDARVRGETLDLSEFAKLSDHFTGKGIS